jgi:hypothetical protein
MATVSGPAAYFFGHTSYVGRYHQRFGPVKIRIIQREDRRVPVRIRVNELARELEVRPNFLLETLQKMGVDRKLTFSSSIEVELAEKLRQRLGAEQGTMRAPDATSVLEFLPESTIELELEPDANARLGSLAEEVATFRAKGALKPMAARKLGEYFRLQHIYHSTGIEGNRLSLRETEVVWTSRREQRRVAEGKTYEPRTFIEHRNWISQTDN